MSIVITEPGRDGNDHRPRSPRLSRGHVHRERLCERFDSAAQVVLVVAPAGSGKTTALAGWIETCTRPTRWVDVAPNAPATRLWREVAETFGVDVSSAEVAARGPNEPIGDVVIRLTDALEHVVDREHVLVLDGLHIDGDESSAALAMFLQRIPSMLQVVISTRHPLPLPLDGLRMRGDLSEVGYDELAFTSSESRAVLAELAPCEDSDFLEELAVWADGWVAPLALGAMVSRSCRDERPEIDTVLHLLRDYVIHDVLVSEDRLLVDFLLDIAVSDKVTAAMANAVTGGDLGAPMLERAEERTSFVRRVGVHGWYEFQSTFRHTLAYEAERRDCERLNSCRRSAAAWLGQHDETVAALELWLQAGDPRAALGLLAARHVQLYESGLQRTICEFAERIAHDGAVRDLGDMIDLTWCSFFTDRKTFVRGVAEAVWWAERDGHVNDRQRRQLHGLQAIAALVDGDFERGRSEALLAVDGDEAWWEDSIGATMWNDLARCIALDEGWDDADDAIREITVRARRHPARRLVLEATRSLGEAIAGRPIDALRVAAGVKPSPHLDRLEMSRAELQLADVIARRELGDAPDARVELERLVELDLEPTTCVRGLAALELVQFHLDRGAVDEATRSFDVLEQLVGAQLPGPAGRRWTARIGTVLALELGDHVEALRRAASIDDPFWGPVSRARVGSVTGDEDVAIWLDAAVPRCPRHHVVHTMLQASTNPDRAASLALAERAVSIAGANGMLQTLGSTGQFDLIERAAWRLPTAWMDRLRRTTANARHGAPTTTRLVEPLTVRERDVLRFLPSRLTLKEIADELYVSVNTLKFHLKVIYRKLGVNSRAEAAEIARSWGRIDSN